MELKRLSLLDYLLLPSGAWRTGLSDYYFSDTEHHAAFGLSEDGIIRSYAIIKVDNRLPVLVFILTDPERRRQGFATRLVRMTAEILKSDMECRMLSSLPCFTEMNGLMEKLGASSSLLGNVYTATVSDRLWARMDKLKMNRMRELILRGGGECRSFQQADPYVKKQLFDSPFSEFDNKLDPRPFINNPHVDWELSSAYIRNDRLCAYTLLTRQGQDAVCFEQISVSREAIGKGAVAAPLTTSLEAVRFAVPKIRQFNLEINNGNDSSYSLVMTILKDQGLRITENRLYHIKAP